MLALIGNEANYAWLVANYMQNVVLKIETYRLK